MYRVNSDYSMIKNVIINILTRFKKKYSMKIYFMIIGILLVITSCSNSDGNNSNQENLGKDESSVLPESINEEILTYHENGEIKSEGLKVNGKREGEWLEYDDSGRLKLKLFYDKGKMDGEQFEYWNDGQVESKENYENGKKEGEQIEYYKNGNFSKKFYFKNGKKDGKSILYRPDGTERVYIFYENGVEKSSINVRN